ncbi:MAG: DUF692 family multinuclear iron-containing protein [Xanthobacteraceae bacterium]
MHVPVRLPAVAGIGFKPQHFDAILADDASIGFVEIHAENYMGAGGAPHAQLRELCARFELSVHGVGLSIGSARPLDREHLARVKALCDRYRPASFSEHLAWSTHNDSFLNDLLPLPYTAETLGLVAAHVDEVQNTLGRQMLLENPSTYVTFAESTMAETDFLAEVAGRTGCGLLLDVNNVFVSSLNHGADPDAYLAAFPIELVRQIHLGGHDVQADDTGAPLLIDSHGSPVVDPVWTLYERVIALTGPLPTLIEWDNDVPDWPVLAVEARAADAILQRAARARAA